MADASEGEGVDVDDLIAQAARNRNEQRVAAADRLRAARVLYSDSDGEPLLRESFVIYLDALGTKEAMAALDDAALREHVRLLDDFRWFLHDDELEGDFQRFMSFSDNVVVGAPMDDEGEPGARGLGMLLTSIDGYQINMAVHGRFLRGGVAAGPLFMDDRFITGQALVDAVLIEEHSAIYPRVVISTGCVEMILRDVVAEFPSPEEFQQSPWNTQVLVDSDGLVFVNYLHVVDDGPPDQQIERIAAGLARHRDAIQEKLEAFPNPGRIREK